MMVQYFNLYVKKPLHINLGDENSKKQATEKYLKDVEVAKKTNNKMLSKSRPE